MYGKYFTLTLIYILYLRPRLSISTVSGQCRSFQIIDGETVYGKYCTSDFDLHFRSETNVVFIQFVSNPLVAYGGFEGNYTLVNSK